jgi:hypothetical protein
LIKKGNKYYITILSEFYNHEYKTNEKIICAFKIILQVRYVEMLTEQHKNMQLNPRNEIYKNTEPIFSLVQVFHDFPWYFHTNVSSTLKEATAYAHTPTSYYITYKF